MNTISVISSISFNTVAFFEAKVNELTRLGKGQIADWCHWIVHLPDTDQKKPHIHFVLKPSRRIDTNSLRQEFLESPSADYVESRIKEGIAPIDAVKPLGVMPFVKTTSMTDWLLYAVHDVGYLFKKGQNRNTHYERSDVKSTDPDFLASQWDEANDPLQSMTQKVVELYQVQQMSFSEILQQGLIPPNLTYYFKQIIEGLNEPVRRRGDWKEDIRV